MSNISIFFFFFFRILRTWRKTIYIGAKSHKKDPPARSVGG